MQASAQDPEGLNPRRLLEYFMRILKSERHRLNEVVIRRIISAVYFALLTTGL